MALDQLPGLTRNRIDNSLNPHVRGYHTVTLQARREREWVNVSEASMMLEEKSAHFTHESERDLVDLFGEE